MLTRVEICLKIEEVISMCKQLLRGQGSLIPCLAVISEGEMAAQSLAYSGIDFFSESGNSHKSGAHWSLFILNFNENAPQKNWNFFAQEIAKTSTTDAIALILTGDCIHHGSAGETTLGEETRDDSALHTCLFTRDTMQGLYRQVPFAKRSVEAELIPSGIEKGLYAYDITFCDFPWSQLPTHKLAWFSNPYQGEIV